MLTVELDIFSGRPNPKWILTRDEEQELLDRIMAQPSMLSPVEHSFETLGYRGFIIEHVKDDDGPWSLASSAFRASSASGTSLPILFRIPREKNNVSASNIPDVRSAAEWLLKTSEKPYTGVDDFLREVTSGSINLHTEKTDVIASSLDLAEGAGMSCASTYLSGKDFDTWNYWFWRRWFNNCYCYAANYIAGHFATPGKIGGKAIDDPKKFSDLKYMKSALQIDGWQESCAKSNSLVIAMVVWPNNDFHFYRKILKDPLCGHKPGTTDAKSTDNSNKAISSPETCDRGMYTIFHGYWYRDNSTSKVD